ncbi:MAG: hypothetical protein A3J27_03320 [Candidatus Tectomicrobia bacterium RIFCSPLOWO2_12_FULL_69_37]|nr:MAG: hypothetical protein A3J27_03320 [Candidatus Tectomicrobia bacterium RIFCSPLOWO2_12_FULL_69_37]
MAKIELEKLSKDFGRFRAVDGVDLEIQDGEFMVFVGPSGCGKTTTLNMIAGFERPSAGAVRIGGRVVNDMEPGERDLGMVFQSLALFPHMTVFDNIAFGLRVKKTGEGEVRARVQAVTATMKIAPLLSKRPGQLSGGEAQRVALARTVVNNPSAFLMDEPLSSLDAKLRVEMRTELKRLHTTLGSTFIYVTHDQAEAMTMADRIAVMKDGRVQQVGEPLDIYNDPVNMFVAGFFGVPSMNFIHGRLEARGGSLAFASASLLCPLDGKGARPDLAGRAVNLGVRPENIRIVEGGDAGSGAVNLIEPLGDETLVHIESGGNVPLITKVESTHHVRPGEKVSFEFKRGQVVLFDAGTQDRIRL